MSSEIFLNISGCHSPSSALAPTIKKELGQMRKEYLQQKSKESIIARDTDILECLIQAKEYYEQKILDRNYN